MIIVSKYIIPKGYQGITLFPFIFLKAICLKHNKTLINHEKIHLKQQLELLIIPFYVLYSFEFFLKLIWYENWKKAYINISFEREAYKNETDLKYLQKRPFWNFIHYF